MNRDELRTIHDSFLTQVSRAVLGQDKAAHNLLATVVAGGHVLLEGVPGTAKTLLVRSLAMLLGGKFKRIQFTPDLMPADMIGTRVFNLKESAFEMYFGPIFTDFLLADEINRTPPKTQAALLEAMQERAATIDGTRYDISPLFTVFATQNPIEYEGTYPLPEAQLDRFMLKVYIGYPEPEKELQMLTAYNEGRELADPHTLGLKQVMDSDQLLQARKLADEVTAEQGVIEYILNIISATRSDDSVRLGASPRAAVALLKACKASAALAGRDYINPDDVKSLALPVLGHRIVFTPDAEIEGMSADQLIEKVLDRTEVPR
ncbi:MAG: MoxR family ATPase [Planctomycetota bacterium]|nr:MoxR family ATPase [Planctomycetota bacterium]